MKTDISRAANVTAIILTFNEEANLEKCLESLQCWVNEIFVIDSHSTDNTLAIAEKYTDKIYQRPFKNQADQCNWALDNLPISTEWILRLDADEMVMPELSEEICRKLPLISSDVSGLYIKRRVYFMGRWIRHGGYYPTWLLRLWRKGKARYEERLMDEHIVLLEGDSTRLSNDIIDWNSKGLNFWIEKHNQFASREMQVISTESETASLPVSLTGSQAQRKRWIKERVYLRMPLFLRAFIYFFYRYFFKLGFLDGKEGLIFHFLQGFWYRFLVDAKIYERAKD